jgi:hypothetical protein
MIHVVEDEGCGLVDRRGPRAGRGIGGSSGMDGERIETWQTVGHGSSLFLSGTTFCSL